MKKRPTAAIILGAGRGTRLKNIVSPYSKTILDVNGLPVIGYAARAVEQYVDKIILVAHPSTADDVQRAVANSLRNRSRKVEVALQSQPQGMADAIRVGMSILDEDHTVVVVAGDNIVLDGNNVKECLDLINPEKGNSRKIAWTYRELLPPESSRFSVYKDLGNSTGQLIEKPQNPPSKICWCGPVAFRSSDDALQRMAALTPSTRGEYEAIDLMNTYNLAGESVHIKLLGEWFDVGTPESLDEARRMIYAMEENV